VSFTWPQVTLNDTNVPHLLIESGRSGQRTAGSSEILSNENSWIGTAVQVYAFSSEIEKKVCSREPRCSNKLKIKLPVPCTGVTSIPCGLQWCHATSHQFINLPSTTSSDANGLREYLTKFRRQQKPIEYVETQAGLLFSQDFPIIFSFGFMSGHHYVVFNEEMPTTGGCSFR